ncbi:winged helix-turn-helix transcriptional regulator [Terricaulis silvestris]|uniref:HTH-type transcriptional activator HxlR n=1 Tax=Terricaulis silvestris TaxID=2686094 RepID=A0A6I6MRK3_9CAUL|nr:helix-turn-helix domain-containing protein [Terricaulis silvestris]QGZ96791.1 HTH-type transcriptional activator HxlR [Terricaulis silvestris]
MTAHLKQPGEPIAEDCPMRAAMSAIGGKWSLILLYWLDKAPRRFNELQRLVPDISHKVLTEVLRTLEDEALITRTVCGTNVEYAISPHGQSASPLIDAIHDWGQAHLARSMSAQR